MSQDQWTAVDRYITDALLPPDPILAATLKASTEGGLPVIQVADNQGKLLSILAGAIGARRILEIGTLGGYSTIWLARALPADGHLITLEVDPTHAEVARANIAHANLSHIVEIRVGRAIDTLPQIAAEKLPPFDLVFIDADKPNNAAYFAWALRLTRRGSLIIIDNVVRSGAIIDAASTDASVQGARHLFEVLAAEQRIMVTALQTVGSKGYDGFAIALVIGD